MARVFELGADAGVVIPRAEELGRAGRWSEAARLLSCCGRRGPLSQQLAQAWTIACLHAKDYAGYREACAADLAWQGSDPTVVWNALSAASVFTLGPKGLDDYRLPITWMESRLSAVPAPRPLIRHYFSNALGGLLLRAGRLDEAINRINKGIAAAKEVEVPTDWICQALAHARKGTFSRPGKCSNASVIGDLSPPQPSGISRRLLCSALRPKRSWGTERTSSRSSMASSSVITIWLEVSGSSFYSTARRQGGLSPRREEVSSPGSLLCGTGSRPRPLRI